MRSGFAVLFLLTIAGQASNLMAQSPGTFTVTGSMTTQRTWHTATLLPDGRVLITGGASDNAASVASAEIFDPATGSFSATGNMTASRSEHTATLLPNGKVLIAGGDNVIPGTAELYDPSTGSFTATGTMIADGSYFHTASLLPDGTVLLVAQGYYGYGAQIYDPSTGTFSRASDPLAAPYGDNTATTLADGTILLTQTSETNGELYYPTAGSFTRTLTRVPWIEGTATLLLTGQVLLNGGNAYTDVSALAALYTPFGVKATAPPNILDDAAPNDFVQTGSMTVARGYASATLLPDGDVLVAGGEANLSGDFTSTFSSAELYSHATGEFTSTGAMTTPRSYHTATLLNNGQVLIAGGSADIALGWTPGSSAELYTPASLVSAPSLFTVSGASNGAGAIWHAATGALVSATNPAMASEVLAMYTSNLASTGVIPPQVIVGGQLAQVIYFGAAPGYAGYYQVNFQVPAGVVTGASVPVRLTYLGRSSNQVAIAVQ